MNNSRQDPTADYRKYPKSPSFLGVVVSALVFILIAFVIAYMVIHREGAKLIPHGPSRTPNSAIRPADGQALPRAA